MAPDAARTANLQRELDSLREVLRDVVEEHGLGEVLRKLAERVRSANVAQHETLLRLKYLPREPVDYRALERAHEELGGVLLQLSALVRDPQLVTLVEAQREPCPTCGAHGSDPCNVGRHGAAWCFHLRCGRLMRGGVCDTCRLSPPPDEVALVAPAPADAPAVPYVRDPFFDNEVLVIGPREVATTWCGGCGARPGQQCVPGCDHSLS